ARRQTLAPRRVANVVGRTNFRFPLRFRRAPGRSGFFASHSVAALWRPQLVACLRTPRGAEYLWQTRLDLSKTFGQCRGLARTARISRRTGPLRFVQQERAACLG